MAEGEQKKSWGRHVGEAILWGVGFAIGAGAAHLAWGAITGGDKKKSDGDDADDDYNDDETED